MIVIPKTQRLLSLTDLKDNLLDGGSLRLFQNDFSPSGDSEIGDFVVATYTGYANKTVATWGDAFLDPTGLATSLAPLQTFAATGDTVTNTVYGAYYLDVNGDLMWAERFAAPVSFAKNGDTLNMVPKFQLGDIDA